MGDELWKIFFRHRLSFNSSSHRLAEPTGFICSTTSPCLFVFILVSTPTLARIATATAWFRNACSTIDIACKKKNANFDAILTFKLLWSTVFVLREQWMCMVTDIRDAMTKWKPKAYTYDFFFTILWSVFISSSDRPFKGPLVGRSEVLWSTDQRLLGRPTRDPQNDVERRWTKIERKLNEKADFRTVLERF